MIIGAVIYSKDVANAGKIVDKKFCSADAIDRLIEIAASRDYYLRVVEDTENVYLENDRLMRDYYLDIQDGQLPFLPRSHMAITEDRTTIPAGSADGVLFQNLQPETDIIISEVGLVTNNQDTSFRWTHNEAGRFQLIFKKWPFKSYVVTITVQSQREIDQDWLGSAISGLPLVDMMQNKTPQQVNNYIETMSQAEVAAAGKDILRVMYLYLIKTGIVTPNGGGE